jgi:hypothetical protein
MGKGYNCGGSGKTELGFRVTIYPTETVLMADVPAGLTVGVVTDEPITGWWIGGDPPEEPKIGLLWIVNGASSMGAFNALRRNGIQVNPIGAYQYTTDGWKDKAARTCVNGIWLPWEPDVVYLFKSGNQYIDITGGWSGVEAASETLSVSAYYKVDSVGVPGRVSTQTQSAVDLTNYGLLCVVLDACNKDFSVFLVDDSGNTIARKTADSVPGTVMLDLRNISGSYYIRLHADGSYADGYGAASITASEVRLVAAETYPAGWEVIL